MSYLNINELSASELKDSYIKLHEEFLELKKYTRKQENEITKLQTKQKKLTADYNKDKSGYGADIFRSSNFELMDKNQDLQQLVSQLQSKNKNLEAKLKVANIQLRSVQQRKLNSSYYSHITPRIDTGLKNLPRRAKSLTNISSLHDGNVRRSSSGNIRRPVTVVSSEDSVAFSSPNYKNTEQGLPSHVKIVLEEARKKIIELSEDQEQLIEKLIETQQKGDEIEEDFRERIDHLEKELDQARISLKERKLKEEKELSTFIRTERESHSANSQLTFLQERLNDLEIKLEGEKRHKDELMDNVEKLKLENYVSENKLKETQLNNEKLNYCNKELKEKNLYLQKQISQLELENDHLTKLSMSVDNVKIKNQETVFVSHVKNEMEIMKDLLKVEKEEKQSLYKELMQYKEQIIEKESELKHLNIAHQDAISKLNKITKDGIYDSSDINKLIESCKESSKKNKVNGFEKLAFNELERKFNELQWLYREKKIELEKLSTLLTGHAETYKQIDEEKEYLIKEHIKVQKELGDRIDEQEKLIHEKEETCTKMNQQLKSLTSKTMKENLTRSDSKYSEESSGKVEAKQCDRNVALTLSYGKHYNVLEFSLNKIAFIVQSMEAIKSFVSWVIPFELVDPMQHTNLAIGPDAMYKHSVLYKFKMNYQNYLSIQEGNVLLNVFILLSNGHPVKVGECDISLKELLKKPSKYCDTTPIKAAIEENELPETGTELPRVIQNIQTQLPGSLIGTLHFEIRLLRSADLDDLMKFSPPAASSGVSPNPSKSVGSFQRQTSVIEGKEMSPLVHQSSLSQNLCCKNNLNSKTVTSNNVEKVENVNVNRKKGADDNNETAISSSNTGKSIKKMLKSSTHSLDISSNSGTEKEKYLKQVMNLQSKSSSNISELSKQNVSKRKSPMKKVTSDKKLKLVDQFAANYSADKDTFIETNPSSNKDVNLQPKPKRSLTEKLRKVFQSSRSKSKKEENQMCVEEKEGIESEKMGMTRSISSKKSLSLKSDGDSLKEKDVKHENESNSDTYFEEHSDDESSSDSSTSDEESTLTDQFSKKDGDEDTLHHTDQKSGGYKKESDVSSDSGPYSDVPTSNSGDVANSKEGDTKALRVKDTAINVQKSGSRRLIRSEVIAKLTDASQSSSESSSVSESKAQYEDSFKSLDYVNYIHIEVTGVKLYKNTRVMNDPTVKYLFVDYHGFLGLDPSSLETPQSLPKPSTGKTIYFNFKNTIDVDKKKYPLRWESFKELILEQGLLKFTLTSEPPPDLQEVEDCKDLGCTFVNMKNFLHSAGTSNIEYIIEDLETKESIGTLIIQISFSNA